MVWRLELYSRWKYSVLLKCFVSGAVVRGGLCCGERWAVLTDSYSVLNIMVVWLWYQCCVSTLGGASLSTVANQRWTLLPFIILIGRSGRIEGAIGSLT